MRLLECEVTEVQSEDDGTLILKFLNEDTLIIRGDNGPYESYHIKLGERVITV